MMIDENIRKTKRLERQLQKVEKQIKPLEDKRFKIQQDLDVLKDLRRRRER